MKKTILILCTLCAAFSISAQENLLENGGFETYKNNGFLGVQFEGWGVPTGSAAELNDVHSGSVALYMVETNMATNKVDQELVGTFEEGETYRLSIWYKVTTPQTGGDVKFNSHWICGTDGDSEHDASVLKSEYFTASEWTEASIETTVPKGATRFYFRVEVTKKAQVLFDDFSFVKLEKEPVTEPYIEITPATFTTVQTTINTPVNFAPLTVKYGNLTSPILTEITGANSEFFTLNRTTVKDGEEKWTITYLPTTAGKHSGNLIIDIRNHPELSGMIKLSASAIDPNAKPAITITPISIPKFTAKAGEQSTCTLTVNSENCIDYVYANVEHTKGTGFTVNNTMLPKNSEAKVVVTFRPTIVGEYASTLTLSTLGGTSVMVNLQGTATAVDEEKPEYATEFVWNQTNPYKLLNEKFDDVTHNKMLTITDWQNVVPTGERPWWGYEHKDATDNVIEKSAKATTYIWQHENLDGKRGEMWLVTPALDYKNAKGKVFTFRVMGDFMFEGHDTKFELYYIDATPGLELYQQNLEIEMPNIPDQNGEWIDYHVDLTGQDIADVFFMAFRYDGKIGDDNSVVYYIDDVSWGRTDLPVITADSMQVVMNANPNIAISSGVITIEGKNLTEDIKVTVAGANASKFSVYPETLPTNGGQIAVAFQSDQIGVHEAYLKLSSRGAVDKIIPMAVLVQDITNELTSIAKDNVIVYTHNSTLHIQADKQHDITIYNASGICVWRNTTNVATIPVAEKGIYLVSIDNEIVKIVVQ